MSDIGELISPKLSTGHYIKEELITKAVSEPIMAALTEFERDLISERT